MDMQRHGRAAKRRVAAEAGDNGKYKALARLGYASRGVVYVIVGALAVLAAWGGGGGQTTDTKGALQSLMDEPFGWVLIGVLALGLVAFAVWRAVQAFADADRHGSDGKALVIRGGMAVSAVTHLLLAVFAASLAFGWGSAGGGSGDSGTQSWIAKLMQQPYGVWLVAIVGLSIIGAGIAQIVKGVKVKFEKRLDADESAISWLRPVCRFGLIARGIVFVIIGGFIGIAAWQSDPQEARGLAGALETLRSQPYGEALLGVVALGLIAFGIYCFVEAIYRRIGMGAG